MEVKINMFFDNISFDPLNVILTKPTMMQYGIKSEDIMSDFNKYITEIIKETIQNKPLVQNQYNTNILDNFFVHNMDFRNSIMAFYTSYKFQFGEKTTLSASAKHHYKQFGYKNKECSQRSLISYKKNIFSSNKYLTDILNSILSERQYNRRENNLPLIAAQVVTHSICEYSSNPTNRNKLESIKQIYDLKKLETFLKTIDFSNIDAYIFEKIYHIRLVCEILKFYTEFMKFIDSLPEHVLTFEWKLSANCLKESDYTYFSATNVVASLREYAFKFGMSYEALKDVCINKLNIFITNLCRFSLLDDVYTRTDLMIMFIRENCHNIMHEGYCLDAIKRCVSLATRNNIIKDDVFYYGTLDYSLSKYISKKDSSVLYDKYGKHQSDNSFQILSNLLKNIDSSLFNYDEYLGETIAAIESYISTPLFDLNIKGAVDETVDSQNFLHNLLQKMYFDMTAIKCNEDFNKHSFFDDDFYSAYRNLLNDQMHRIIDSNKLQDLY